MGFRWSADISWLSWTGSKTAAKSGSTASGRRPSGPSGPKETHRSQQQPAAAAVKGGQAACPGGSLDSCIGRQKKLSRPSWKVVMKAINECQLYRGGRPVVGKMTAFDLWPLPLGGGAWVAGTNMWHPEIPASYESLPTILATQIS
jgi:hypothetical protein